ncbi:hypothetical protein MHM98_09735 [Psychrobium sp. MM17-31]|uniref:hypothetical protein n=1 Tax=Psychrobium sp. MM17-31 TaxID=2917758 RepID=UPI001EF55E9D|nr:hypothetical protein [Psychrobium sp. MM17-31]MCG7531620.1 hypothetical protein [Psychrobium sp. MM17-31]
MNKLTILQIKTSVLGLAVMVTSILILEALLGELPISVISSVIIGSFISVFSAALSKAYELGKSETNRVD